jgi:hypothetical protein
VGDATDRQYAAVCPSCGRVAGQGTTRPYLVRSILAGMVYDWIRDGYSVERLTEEEQEVLGRGHAEGCPMRGADRKPKRML